MLPITPSGYRSRAAVAQHRALGFVPERTKLWYQACRMVALGGSIFRRMAVERTRESGYRKLEIESDPNAEGFYQHMGAQRVGASIKEVDGQRRELPILIYDIDPVA